MRGLRSGELARWATCFVFVLGCHAAAAAAMLARWQDEPDITASAPVILVDLAPVAVAPPTPDIAPGIQQTESEPEPVKEPPPEEKVEVPPAEKAEVVLTPPPKPEPPKDKKPIQKQVAKLTSAPSPAERRAERAAAPNAGAGMRQSASLPGWKSQLLAQLERNKRYPTEARSRGEVGVALLAFSIDRRGAVHNARIAKSSGSSILDRETLALAQRAQPLPPPPDDVPGAHIAIVVPIRYNIN